MTPCCTIKIISDNCIALPQANFPWLETISHVMSCSVVIKQEETDVDVEVDNVNITSNSSYGQVR